MQTISTASIKDIRAEEHWANKDGVKIFLWRKRAVQTASKIILFVHGSSMSGRPTFDLQVPGQENTSAMDWFARRGFDVWCVDMEGYGRSDKIRDINCDISNGADDLEAASRYIESVTGQESLLVYGISSGALRAALFTERNPGKVSRLALDAFVWTGKNSRTLSERRQNLSQYLAANRRPVNLAFVRSIFDRDKPGVADMATIDAFSAAILEYDTSLPNGSYVDMCSKLPLIDPAKVIVPTLIMRGEHDGIASFEDLVDFFVKLPNPDKTFSVMPGISHASFQQKNFKTVFHILHGFFTRPELAYNG